MRLDLKHYFLFLGLIGFIGCTSTDTVTRGTNAELDLLVRMMTGTFHSQSSVFINGQPKEITLHVYPIWTGRGNWFYVEELGDGKPLRQRIYHLEQMGKGRFRSVVYALPEPEKFVGAWKEPARFSKLNPLALGICKGCDVYWERVGKRRFEGTTHGRSCESHVGGSQFATTEMVIAPGTLERWDKGFDSSRRQVGGPTKGASVFKKR